MITQIKSEFPERPVKLETVETPTKNDLVDNELITIIVNEINDAQEWKDIAQNLNMDEDTIGFIESETQDVKQQSRKILQLWKVAKSHTLSDEPRFSLIYYLVSY